MIIEVKENLYRNFPQADDIYKIIKICDEKSFNQLKDLMPSITFNNLRQKQYYYDAARYLNLIEPFSNSLNDCSKIIFKLDKNVVLTIIASIILSNKPFYLFYIGKKVECINYLKCKYSFSESTLNRRLLTVKKWSKWAENVLKNEEIKFYEI